MVSARRKLSTIEGLPSGTAGNAHRKYEDAVSQLLASLLYPQLDFAAEQSRTVDGVLIRDLILYNNRDIDFLAEIYDDYGSRQLVFELKNVAQVEREHVNQLNRYLNEGLGGFGVIVTRNRLSKAMRRNTIDLWSGQRKCVVPLTDEDLSLMVELFESRQRSPIDVLKRAWASREPHPSMAFLDQTEFRPIEIGISYLVCDGEPKRCIREHTRRGAVAVLDVADRDRSDVGGLRLQTNPKKRGGTPAPVSGNQTSGVFKCGWSPKRGGTPSPRVSGFG